jgi:hypothetical protein
LLFIEILNSVCLLVITICDAKYTHLYVVWL